MHLVLGFLITSLLRKKNRMKKGLPSIRGKLETVHALPGRLRLNSQLLVGLQSNTHQKIGAEIKKIDGIDRVDINAHTGSLLIVYSPSVIQPFVVHGIVVKVLGLENEMAKSPAGWLTREMDLLGHSLNQQIYQSSSGMMDLKSSLIVSLLALSLYRIVIQRERALPGGINLLWWTYVMTQKGK